MGLSCLPSPESLHKHIDIALVLLWWSSRLLMYENSRVSPTIHRHIVQTYLVGTYQPFATWQHCRPLPKSRRGTLAWHFSIVPCACIEVIHQKKGHAKISRSLLWRNLRSEDVPSNAPRRAFNGTLYKPALACLCIVDNETIHWQ